MSDDLRDLVLNKNPAKISRVLETASNTASARSYATSHYAVVGLSMNGPHVSIKTDPYQVWGKDDISELHDLLCFVMTHKRLP